MPYVIKMGSKKVSKRIPLIVPMTLCLVNATLTRSIIVLSLDFNKSMQKAEEILIELRWILVATCPLNVLLSGDMFLRARSSVTDTASQNWTSNTNFFGSTGGIAYRDQLSKDNLLDRYH